MESKQAQVITEAMMEVLNDSMENVSGSYVSKSEMQKVSCVSISVDCVCVFVNGGGVVVVFNLCDFVCFV